MTVEEKGLPFHKNPYKFGNLFILFTVKFPDSLTGAQTQNVASLLSDMKRQKTDDDMVSETCKLQEYSEEQRNPHHQGGAKGVDSEDEDEDPRMRGGQKV